MGGDYALNLVLKQQLFDHKAQAQTWALAECQPSDYVPKDPNWKDLQAYLLKNGKRAKIRYSKGKLAYVATILRSPWWEAKLAATGDTHSV